MVAGTVKPRLFGVLVLHNVVGRVASVNLLCKIPVCHCSLNSAYAVYNLLLSILFWQLTCKSGNSNILIPYV